MLSENTLLLTDEGAAKLLCLDMLWLVDESLLDVRRSSRVSSGMVLSGKAQG